MIDDADKPLIARTSAVRRPLRAAIADTVSPGWTSYVSGAVVVTRRVAAEDRVARSSAVSAPRSIGATERSGCCTACAGAAVMRTASDPASAGRAFAAIRRGGAAMWKESALTGSPSVDCLKRCHGC